jgi:hypothetical protein
MLGGMSVARFVWAASLVGLVVVLLGIPLLLGHPTFPPHRPTNVSTPANIIYGAISGFLLGDGIMAVESLAAPGRKPSHVIDSLS